MTVRATGKKEPAIVGWTTDGLGWSALRDSAQPIGWPVYLIAITVIVLLALYRESLKLTQALQLAVAPLSVLLAIGSLPLLKQLVTSGLPDDVESAESMPGGAPNTADELVARVLGSLAILASLNILSILLYVALPRGQVQDTLGLLSVALLLAIVIFSLKIPALTRWQRLYGVENAAPDASVPSTGGKFAWVLDLAICAIIVVIVPLVWGAVTSVSPITLLQDSPMIFWISTVVPCYLYQLISVRVWGQTLGQRTAWTRVATAVSGTPLGLWRTSLRILIPMSPVSLFYLVLLLVASDNSGSEDSFLSYALDWTAAVFMISILLGVLSNILIRNIHPRGQGLLDLVMRTVSVREQVRREQPSEESPES